MVEYMEGRYAAGQGPLNEAVKSDFEFFLTNYCRHAAEKGSLYTWGSGEMGQLGYSSRIISQMPKDRDGYPFQVNLAPF